MLVAEASQLWQVNPLLAPSLATVVNLTDTDLEQNKA